MNSIKINNNNFNINNQFPTFSKAWEGSTSKKAAFVFASVLTSGLLPLFLIIYDFAKDLIYGRKQNAVLIKNFKPVTLSDYLKNLDTSTKALLLGSILLGSGLVYFLNKSEGPDIATSFFNGMDKMKEIGNTLGSSFSSLKDGLSNTVASKLNIFMDKMQDVRGRLAEFSNGLSSRQVFAIKLAASLPIIGIECLIIKNLINNLKNNEKKPRVEPAKNKPYIRPVPSAPSAPIDASEPESERYYPRLPQNGCNSVYFGP